MREKSQNAQCAHAKPGQLSISILTAVARMLRARVQNFESSVRFFQLFVPRNTLIARRGNIHGRNNIYQCGATSSSYCAQMKPQPGTTGGSDPKKMTSMLRRWAERNQEMHQRNNGFLAVLCGNKRVYSNVIGTASAHAPAPFAGRVCFSAKSQILLN